MTKQKIQKGVDELIADALIPKVDQLYEIPENWVWVRFGCVCKLKSGFAFKSKFYTQSGIPIIRISEIQDGNINTAKAVSVPKEYFNENFIIKKGDLLIAMSGATTGKSGIYEGEQIVLQNQRVGNIAIINNELLENQFRNYYIKRSEETILKLAYGGAQPNISASIIESLPFPLPPLPEQKRIVTKLTSMLENLKQAKELIQEAKESFEKRRAAILHLAFTGELTAKWRKLAKEQNSEWETVRLEDITKSISDGDHQAPPKSKSGIPFIVISNIKNNIIDFSATKYVSEEYFENIKEQRKPEKGDLLYTVTGSYGIPVLVKDDVKFCFQRHIAILKPKNGLNNKYLFYVLSSSLVFEQASSVATGTAQLTVPLRGLRGIEIPLPQLNEQKEIVRILDNLLGNESEALSLLGQENHIDLLEKSILSKAFRGELDTNDPDDEPAKDLLKKILQERQKTPLKKATKKQPKPKPKNITISAKPVSVKVTAQRAVITTSKESQYLFETIKEKMGKRSFSMDELKSVVDLSYEELKSALFDLIKEPLKINENSTLKMVWENNKYSFELASFVGVK